MIHHAKIWNTVPHDGARATAVARDLNLPLPAAVLLAGRGFADGDAVRSFLAPRLSTLSDPFLLPDAEKAAARIWESIDRGEPIAVYGDYDVDGITATALLVRFLGGVGARVTPFLPLRLEEGYGLSPDGLRRCVEESRPKLIITVDCGTGSVEAVKLAGEMGITVIITDHHTPSSENAAAFALVNPKLGSDTSLHILAGVGVAFKLCHALAKLRRDRCAHVDLKKSLDFVALGTIADIVPLSGENRILARHGLAALNATDCIGLKALAKVAGITGAIDAYEVGFRLGPRLNAAGRLGDALNSLKLLLTDSETLAELAARELDESNRQRQDVEKQIVQEAMERIQAEFDPARDFAVVAFGEGWHPGVIGIVASRLCQQFHRPVACIAMDGKSGRGSCRSIDCFDMVAGLGRCSDLLVKFGGHAMAAGLELELDRLDDFRRRFNEVARELLAGADLRPVQRVDAWLGLRDVDNRLLDTLDQMRPFGVGNTTPTWASRGVRIVGQPKTVGHGHLKFLAAQGGVQREAIAWNMADRPIPPGELDLAFQVKKDHYMGRDKLVLNVQDFRASETALPVVS